MKSLHPFQPTRQTQQLQLQAELFQLSEQTLLAEFRISGFLDRVLWPSSHETEVRVDELWKTTCLEVFVAAEKSNTSPYVEINCSPNGNWNAYSFSSYRQGMTPSSHITVRLKERAAEGADAHFRIEIHSPQPLSSHCVGLSAVIEFIDGEKSYWALQHPKPQADFHDKNGWL